MKTAMIAAGMVCALGTASGQQDAGDGPLTRFAVEFNGTREFRVGPGGSPVTRSDSLGTSADVAAPGAWEWDSFDSLDSAASRTNAMLEIEVGSTTDRLFGRLDAFASALSSGGDQSNESPSTRTFNEVQIVAEPLDVIADVIVTIDVNTSLNGFGQAQLGWNVFSDDFSARDIVFTNQNESFSMLYEDVNLTFFELQLRASADALTDSPVNNANAFIEVDWSVEIIPIPAPGSAAGLLMLGGLALRRRR